MKIYIIGKSSGIPLVQAQAKFEETEQLLAKAGVNPENIVNRMKLGIPPSALWKEEKDICMEALSNCQAVYVQKDWDESFEARHELTFAQLNKYALFYETSDDIKKIAQLFELQ